MISIPKGYPTIPEDYSGPVWIEGQIQQLEDSIFGESESLIKPVRVLLGAKYAYACISTNRRNLDVQLSSGKSAQASLLEEATALEEEALSKIRRARVMRDAAKEMATKKIEA